jgi:hypothetical protein
MANPGTISKTNAVAVNIQAVVPVSMATLSAAKAILGNTRKIIAVNLIPVDFIFIHLLC